MLGLVLPNLSLIDVTKKLVTTLILHSPIMSPAEIRVVNYMKITFAVLSWITVAPLFLGCLGR